MRYERLSGEIGINARSVSTEFKRGSKLAQCVVAHAPAFGVAWAGLRSCLAAQSRTWSSIRDRPFGWKSRRDFNICRNPQSSVDARRPHSHIQSCAAISYEKGVYTVEFWQSRQTLSQDRALAPSFAAWRLTSVKYNHLQSLGMSNRSWFTTRL